MVIWFTPGQGGYPCSTWHGVPELREATRASAKGVAQHGVKRASCGLAWGVSVQGEEEGAHTEGTEQLKNNHVQGH